MGKGVSSLSRKILGTWLKLRARTAEGRASMKRYWEQEELYASSVRLRSEPLPLAAWHQASEMSCDCNSAHSVWKHLVEHWTFNVEDRILLGNKTGATRLGLAVLLKFFQREAASAAPADVRNALGEGRWIAAVTRDTTLRGPKLFSERAQQEGMEPQGRARSGTLPGNSFVRTFRRKEGEERWKSTNTSTYYR